MKIEFLISTLNRTNLDFLKPIFVHLDYDNVKALVINQCDDAILKKTKNIKSTERIKVISVNEYGLSKSRNLALRNATGDICLICDDDIVFEKGIQSKLKKWYHDFRDISLITYNVTNQVKLSDTKHNLLTIQKIASSAISFRRKEIQQNQIFFDTQFGLGAAYPLGEENIFLSDCLKAHLNLKHFSETLVNHPSVSHSGLQFNRQNAMARGACFKRIYGCWSYVLIPIFAFKKWPLYRKNHSLMKEMLWLYSGAYYYIE